MDETLIIGKTLSARELADELSQCAGRQEVVGLDVETEGINPRKQAPSCGDGRIVCWSVSTPRCPKVFLWADQLGYFKAWLESGAPKVGHNIYSFDYHMFSNAGIVLNGIAADTKRLSRLIYSCKTRSHGLKDLAKNWLGIQQPSYASLFTRPKHNMEFVLEQTKKKGVVTHHAFREAKRKVGEHKGVPTLFGSGLRGRFGKATELIPLSSIPTDYPDRLEALYDYASLDAQLTRLLYDQFKKELVRTEWKVQK
tara:strand:- start:635 stop:1396 length:762 start_codon:yes stop_codon:yes gene_type:complete